MKARLSLGLIALPLALAACSTDQTARTDTPSTPAMSDAKPLNGITGLRRLTEAQYRGAIADIFGPDIRVAGRFEPIVRPEHHLIATGAAGATISPAGLEQFDAMARDIAAQVFDDAHRPMFVTCKPLTDKGADAACAKSVLAPLGRYLFRRPQTDAELTAYVTIANQSAIQAGSFTKGLELALAAMLVSPEFLYVVESAEPDPTHPGQMRLDGWSRASRLSFLLWNTTPDDRLLKAAASGALDDPMLLEAEARRMVASPRFQDGVRAFFADMLLFEKFDEIAKDNVIYPRFNQTVAAALPEQLLRTIVDHLVTRDGDYPSLFTTRRTFMNRALGPLYGIPVQSRTGWEPHEFAPTEGRAGILSQAGFLSLYSHSGRSSPTLRGRAIRELLLCQPVPNPPGNVNFTAVQNTGNKKMPTARIRLNAHNTDPVCAACHKITDPIGLPLEKFDGIGAFRYTENAAPIDTSGSFEGTDFNGIEGLGKAMAQSSSATQCVASRAYEYATGRSADEEGEITEAVAKGFAQDGYRIKSLMLRVATMPEAYAVHAPALVEPPKLTMLSSPHKIAGGVE